MILKILTVFSVLFFLCSGHQLLFLLIPRRIRQKNSQENAKAVAAPSSAVLICARNEAAVIAALVESVRRQSMPADVFVLADNCTDGTAEIARAAGAVVWERFDCTRIGKGYALSCLLSHMEEEGYRYERYFIFDADNLLADDCLAAMHRIFDAGFPIVTGYRASINFGDNWISAGYALSFLRESRYLNGVRMALGTSSAVSGTGFGFTKEVLMELIKDGDPWPYHLLTEDLEFTADQVLRGRTIGYASNAVFFDEQPTDLRQSFRQRLRWAKGGLQVVRRLGGKLLKKAAGGSFSAWDMLTASFPAALYNLVCTLLHILMFIECSIAGDVMPAVLSLVRTLGMMWGTFFLLGAATMLSEHRRVPLSRGKKIFYTVTFPLFMLTYIPISLASFCCKVKWKPIYHKRREHYVQHTDL